MALPLANVKYVILLTCWSNQSLTVKRYRSMNQNPPKHFSARHGSWDSSLLRLDHFHPVLQPELFKMKKSYPT
jgi:hypothetical protein